MNSQKKLNPAKISYDNMDIISRISDRISQRKQPVELEGLLNQIDPQRLGLLGHSKPDSPGKNY
jgi:hypothetical protein